MSRLTDLLKHAHDLDPQLATELAREIRHTQNQRSFGLVFERHLPDAVELPSRPARRGDTVYILPPRGSKRTGDKTFWTVARIDREAEGGAQAVVVETTPAKGAEPEVRDGVLVEDLVVVAQHDDIIYPGLVQTGEVINSDDPQAPFHTVINSENLHALSMLTYTHRQKVDCIYIDPPYNTGAKDWKYNNDYVDGEDAYRHSKWLSFMEKRLELARELLNPEDSVLIVTIDEKEYLRLGMLLEQTFPEARIQMVSSVINPMGSGRFGTFSRVEEYVFIVLLGASTVQKGPDDMLSQDSENAAKTKPRPVRWTPLHRDGSNWRRTDRPNSFFPLFVDPNTRKIVDYGPALREEQPISDVPDRPGLLTVWPMKGSEEARWQISGTEMLKIQDEGFLRVGRSVEGNAPSISYLSRGVREKVADGLIDDFGRDEFGVRKLYYGLNHFKQPRSVWNRKSHSARDYGTAILSDLLPGGKFPYPKSLYAVEDALRFFVKDKPNATILDFFSGSGTTAHAVVRLNKQDGGRRRSISITNNEVSFEEAKKLTEEGFRPGDPEWERLGICDYVTKPRIKAAITGKTPDGAPIKGDYKFTDEFPMADGFEANARFFSLTYEPPTRVRHGLAFAEIAPLLWLRAGQFGRVLESLPSKGWDVAESHGVIKNVAAVDAFAEAVREMGTVTTIYVVSDDALTSQSAVAKLSDFEVEFVQLYSSYLTNFAFTQSGGRF